MKKQLAFIFASSLFFCFITSCAPKRKEPKRVVKMHQTLDVYGDKVAKAKGLELIVHEDFTQKRAIPNYSLAFRSKQQMNLEEGRRFAVGLVEDFWGHFQKDPMISFHSEYQGNTSQYAPKKLLLKSIAYKIAFFDSDKKLPQRPFLAEVIFANGTLYYYMANPRTQGLELVFQETFHDAVKNCG